MNPINMKNGTTPTVLEVIPADIMTPIWNTSEHVEGYVVKSHDLPIFIDNIMFTKIVPGFDGIYVTNINGDLASVERTVVLSNTATNMTQKVMKPKVFKNTGHCYVLSYKGQALRFSRNGLIFYSGFKKPTFDESTKFPVEYKGKKWICWLPGNLYLKAALASDGSVLTMESMTINNGDVYETAYVYSEEHMSDIEKSCRYRNKEKTIPMTRIELKNLARLKCLVLGITP